MDPYYNYYLTSKYFGLLYTRTCKECNARKYNFKFLDELYLEDYNKIRYHKRCEPCRKYRQMVRQFMDTSTSDNPRMTPTSDNPSMESVAVTPIIESVRDNPRMTPTSDNPRMTPTSDNLRMTHTSDNSYL